MTKPLTIEQAIEALKATDEIRGLRCFVITYSDYHALLALLEGLRWRKVSEDTPKKRTPKLIVNASGMVFFDECGDMESFQNDLWLSLSSILPPAGEPASE